MPSYRAPASRRQAAARTTQGGCLSFFILPPLAAALIGIFLALLLNHPGRLSNAEAQISGQSRLAPLFTREVRYWEPSILSWSAQWDLDPNLIATIIQIESCGDPQASSSAGASGLFQVMPMHFQPWENPYDPQTNARRGLDYLKQALSASDGDIRSALAGYNGGIGLTSLSQADWPQEAIRYSRWGSSIYADAQQGLAASVALRDWLDSGGANLCRQANRRLKLGQ
jgi:soluble lytic murein transglycosylase-like protein